MSSKRTPLWLAAALFFGLMGPFQAHAGLDADSAQSQMKSNKCIKCHATSKDKTGPSLKKIANKYKGKTDAEELLVKFMTTGMVVKLDDGSQEEHKVIKTQDAAELKNLAQWMLSH